MIWKFVPTFGAVVDMPRLPQGERPSAGECLFGASCVQRTKRENVWEMRGCKLLIDILADFLPLTF